MRPATGLGCPRDTSPTGKPQRLTGVTHVDTGSCGLAKAYAERPGPVRAPLGERLDGRLLVVRASCARRHLPKVCSRGERPTGVGRNRPPEAGPCQQGTPGVPLHYRHTLQLREGALGSPGCPPSLPPPLHPLEGIASRPRPATRGEPSSPPSPVGALGCWPRSPLPGPGRGARKSRLDPSPHSSHFLTLGPPCPLHCSHRFSSGCPLCHCAP